MQVFNNGQLVTATTKRVDVLEHHHGMVVETRHTIKGPFVVVELAGGMRKSYRPVNVAIRA